MVHILESYGHLKVRPDTLDTRVVASDFVSHDMPMPRVLRKKIWHAMPRGIRGIPCQIRIPRRRNSAEYRVVYGIIFSSDPWYSAVFYGNPRYYTVFRGIPKFLKKSSNFSKNVQNFKKNSKFQKSSRFSKKFKIFRKVRNF